MLHPGTHRHDTLSAFSFRTFTALAVHLELRWLLNSPGLPIGIFSADIYDAMKIIDIIKNSSNLVLPGASL